MKGERMMINKEENVMPHKNETAQVRILNDFGLNIIKLKMKWFLFDTVRNYEHFKEYWEHSSCYSKYPMRC